MNHQGDPSPFVKAINYVAAFMGIGTFLGMVNLVVGVLSALWLGIQFYGYVKYEIPFKRTKQRIANLEAEKLESEIQATRIED